MRKIFVFAIFLISLVIFSFINLPQVDAADIRANNYVSIPQDEGNLSDLYLFGDTIVVDAPVRNDLVAAGHDVSIDGLVSGDILVAGGSLHINGGSGGTVRVAGGSVVIDGDIARDLVVAGGSVTLSRLATVGGDLIVAGGEINIQGKVAGRVMINGGQARIDGPVGKQVEGHIGRLVLGSNAVVGGNLIYTSGDKVIVENGAKVMGVTRYTQIKEPRRAAEQAKNFFAGVSIYKLIVDIILTVGLIYFFGLFLKNVFSTISKSPVQSGAYGLAFLVLTPIVSLIFMILLWLGLGGFLFYALVLLFSVFVTKAFLGWYLLEWWYGRDKKTYNLDWKAGVVGPISLFVIAFIPVIGWLFQAVLFCVCTGAVIWQLANFFRTQKISARKK